MATHETLEGRMAPLGSPEKRAATRALLLSPMALVTLLASCDVLYVAGAWLGDLVL